LPELLVTGSGSFVDAAVCAIKDGAQFPGMSQDQGKRRRLGHGRYYRQMAWAVKNAGCKSIPGLFLRARYGFAAASIAWQM
jgi:hypothetical protein